jgi:hypothetical protein
MEKDLYSQEEEKKEEKWHYSFVIFLMNNMGGQYNKCTLSG